MIGKLNGKIDSIFQDYLIIDVGGVGYKVSCSGKTLGKLEVGTAASLLIETHVREDNIQLFGFSNISEKQIFLLLTTVKGVGTKVALSVLSALSPEQISNAIAANDKSTYKSLPGVGPKIWERVIIELKDKVMGAAYTVDSGVVSKLGTKIEQTSISQDAISALANLGINKADAYRVVQEVIHNEPEININDLIRKSLKQFAR
ncbi:MAG: ruvA [Rickettsiaceae bacterium]|jgi:Holliday junction DNA helicase RuvA|nr:ruvA [Rickettsiaceae bacterium]